MDKLIVAVNDFLRAVQCLLDHDLDHTITYIQDYNSERYGPLFDPSDDSVLDGNWCNRDGFVRSYRRLKNAFAYECDRVKTALLAVSDIST